ncbi:MAG: 3-deoxy-D-manno-octulosonic acid transferase [Bacteroidales bacterium]|nr:3-deoxy-D-manno-octulosonic acid transferase [Bacteroidales bacterium]
MSRLFDLLYLGVLVILSPWLFWRALTTGRYRHDLQAKLFGFRQTLIPEAPRTVWFHGVSVGEINLLVTLTRGLRNRHPDWRIVISSTTDTGLSEARKQFPDDVVIPFPFDFSWAVEQTFDSVRPTVLVLAESELWPQLLQAAERRGVPVVVANARMSPRSFARLMKVRYLATRLLFRRVRLFAAQSEEIAERLRQLGVPEERLLVTGSVKYDGATGDRASAAAQKLRTLLARTEEWVWVAGSTHAPEESIVLDVFRRLRGRFPRLRLILVPRHPDRFAEVARLVEASGLPFIRRSQITAPLSAMPDVVLLDTVGELGAAWALADLAFTGGSLDGKRGGQSMIEPAGFGVPALFGPQVWNFRDAAQRLIACGGALSIRDAEQLTTAVTQLLDDPALRERMGHAAQTLVQGQQGATIRTLDGIDSVLPSHS